MALQEWQETKPYRNQQKGLDGQSSPKKKIQKKFSKTLDKWPDTCYNKGTKKEGRSENGKEEKKQN